MSSQIRYKRRYLFKAVLCLIPVTVLSRAKLTNKNSRASDYLVFQLTRVFSHPESAKVIGREYLRLWPEEADPDFLIQRIFSRHPAELLQYGEIEPLREMISAQIQSDFKRHHVLAVHGWIFSYTELRLCALAAFV
jgi:hypothetical protein